MKTYDENAKILHCNALKYKTHYMDFIVVHSIVFRKGKCRTGLIVSVSTFTVD
jgi:prepilin signal peptidase PulO-like enzyme (type II secretory pathway)